MTNSELSEKNFKRISTLNWLISIPLILLFAWPYLYISKILSIEAIPAYTGALMFSVPFMATILHGNVTMALGSAHRHHYYSWLADQQLTYGLFFSPTFMRTRFRLVLLICSFILLAIGYLIDFHA